MKSLILSAQDARELEKLGGLTVSKQIKPAPRYIQGAEFTEAAPRVGSPYSGRPPPGSGRRGCGRIRSARQRRGRRLYSGALV